MCVSHDSDETFMQVSHDVRRMSLSLFLAIKLGNGLIYVTVFYICITYSSHCADHGN